MLSIQRIKELVGDPALSDQDAERVRDELRSLAELVLARWREELGDANEAGRTEHGAGPVI